MQPPSAARPGVWRRAAAGAWHVPAGFFFLLRHPPFWPLAVLPAALAFVLSIVGLVASWYYVPRVLAAFAPARDRVGDLGSLAASIALGLATLVTGAVLGLGLALLLTAPLLDLLSQRTEQRERGLPPEQAPGRGLRFEVVSSLRGALFFAAAVPVAFLVGLVPFVGPPLASLWGAFALAFQFTDGPLTRRGRDFVEKLRWHQEWGPEILGFGLAALLAVLVPFANLLVAPALTVGAARLVLDLTGAAETGAGRQGA